MATTLEQITDEFYNLVGSNSGSNVYPITWTENLANIVQKEICRAWKWSFLKKKSLFNTVIDTQLSSAVATTDVAISVYSASNFQSSGAIWIDEDVIDYTATTSTSFTGVTNIGIAHSSGATVEQLYSLPSDYSHRPTMFIFTSGQTRKKYTFVHDFEFDNSDIAYKWTIVVDDSGTKYIRIKSPSTQKIAAFYYYKQASTMTSSVDATIPDDFALSVIPRTMAGVSQVIRGDNIDGIGSIVMQIADKDVREMKNFYGMRDTGEIQTTRLVYGSSNPRGMYTGYINKNNSN